MMSFFNKYNVISKIQIMGWGSQGKPWHDRKNPNTNKGSTAYARKMSFSRMKIDKFYEGNI